MTALRNSFAFAMGFGVALLPSYGPFVGLLVFFGTRWTLRRSDVLWWMAAALISLPLLVRQEVGAAAVTFIQLLLPWLIYRAFYNLHMNRRTLGSTRSVALGLLCGLLVVVTLGWFQLDLLSATALSEVADTLLWGLWQRNPALYGHTVLALGAFLAILLPDARLRVASLGLAALGILVTGSREAAIGWVVVTALLQLTGPPRQRRSRVLELALLSVMLLVAAGLGPLLGWGQVGFLVDLLPPSEGHTNLLQGSEIANGDWWEAQGVSLEASSSGTPGGLTSYTLTKSRTSPAQRLQQAVQLEPDKPYTASVWLRADSDGALPGIQGFGQSIDNGGSFSVTGVLEAERWQASASGAGRLLGSGVLDQTGAWRRVWLSFIAEGDQPLSLWLGLAPDQRETLGTRASFVGFQLEQGTAPSRYTPGSASRGLGLSVARLPYWRAAWLGIEAQPWWGHGPNTFPDYYRRNWPARGQLSDVPARVHNLFLEAWFERGLVGLAGLIVLLGAMSQMAFRRRDTAFLAAFAALLVANAFDSSLFYSGVLYPLAATAGWRAASYRAERSTRETLSRTVRVGLTLAGCDFLTTTLALALAIGTRQFIATLLGLPEFHSFAEVFEVIGFTLLLWPVMVWREGLYPGYGLTPQQELRKQVVAAAYAGLIVAAGTLLFTSGLPVSRVVWVLTIVYSMVLGPVGRSLTKRFLHHAGIWGRRVVILGAGDTGRRVARALRKRPLEGLHPVAFFDDDPAKQEGRVEGLPVVGPLADANAFAAREHLAHAIVAIPRVSKVQLMALIGVKGQAFRQVQFVPDLTDFPSQEVYASSLDGLLALEVRNGLHSKLNQTTKRVLDFVCSSLGTLLIAPVLLAITVWVRLDSPGPAFYMGERLGQDGKAFKCLKFRTMHLDADARLHDLLKNDPTLRSEYETYHKLEQDPRITRAGHVLRKYSLDELAQLLNVVRGDMSLVGPRPYLVGERPEMGGYGEVILEAKPGVTGYWQVSGRNEVTFHERLLMESHYVRNWSLWWDIILLVETVAVVLSRRGAH